MEGLIFFRVRSCFRLRLILISIPLWVKGFPNPMMISPWLKEVPNPIPLYIPIPLWVKENSEEHNQIPLWIKYFSNPAPVRSTIPSFG